MLRRDAVAGAIVLLVVLALDASVASAAKRWSGDGCTGAAGLAASAAAVTTASDSILCLVNRERTKRGLPAVRRSAQLTQSALGFSEDMARRKFFAHVSPGGVNLRQRVAATGYLRNSHSRYIGETIAWGSGEFATPVELVKSLMDSPGHRRILLDGRFRDIGIGLATAPPVRGVGSDGATLTLDFGRR